MIRLVPALAAAFGLMVLHTVHAQEVPKPPAPGRLVAIDVAWAEFDPALLAVDVQGAGAKLLETVRAAAEAQDKVHSFTQVRLSALENSPASVHSGERVNLPGGRVASSRDGGFGVPAGVSPAYQQQNVGTIVSATCRVDEAGQILIDLNIEQSRMAEDGDARPDTADPRVATQLKPVTKTFKTTVSVPDGQTLVLGGMTIRSGKYRRQDVILVTARIVGQTPAAQVIEKQPVPESRTGTIEERMLRYAQQRIKEHDKNGDGVLDGAELAAYLRAPANADQDGDGKVTAEELAAALSRK